MNQVRRTETEWALSTNLAELAQSLVRDLALSIRKASIYGVDHVLSRNGLERTQLLLARFFRFKRQVTLETMDDHLVLIGITVAQSVFADEILAHLDRLGLSGITLSQGLPSSELAAFMSADRIGRGDWSEHLNHISTAPETEQRSRKDVCLYPVDDIDGLTVRRMVLESIGVDLDRLALIDGSPELMEKELGIDWHQDIVAYLLPETVNTYAPDLLVTALACRLSAAIAQPQARAKTPTAANLAKTIALLRYRSDRANLADRLRQTLAASREAVTLLERLLTSVRGVDRAVEFHVMNSLKQLMASPDRKSAANRLMDDFTRLVTAEREDQVRAIVAELFEYMESDNAGCRREAAVILSRMILEVDDANLGICLTPIAEALAERLGRRHEGFESADLICQVIERCFKAGCWPPAECLTRAMEQRRQVVDNVTIYASLAVRQARVKMSKSCLIDQMVDYLPEADHAVASRLGRLLVSIGGTEVARSVARIVANPSRQVRQHALRVLSQLGRDTLLVFQQILEDSALFRRKRGAIAVPADKWHMVRNSIFVLGALRDPKAVDVLRLCVDDPDPRVRSECIVALSKIGGEEAAELLIMMADDPNREVAEAAVNGAALVATPEMAPLMIDIAKRCRPLTPDAILALGFIGGPAAASYLIRIVDDDEEVARLAGNLHSESDLRVAAVTALGRIGSGDAIDRLQDLLATGTQNDARVKLPLRVRQALEEVLGDER